MFANTIIHSKKGCIYCEKAKVELDSLSIQYEEVNYSPEDPDYESRAAALVARTGHKTFPQIFDGQVFLGGYSELKKLLSAESVGTHKFNVKKRGGALKPVDTSEIEERLKFLAIHPYVLESVDVFNLTRTIVNALYNGIETSKIDELSMSCAAELGSDEPEYLTLAARIAVNNHQKNTLGSFFDRMKILMDNVDSEGLPTPILDEAFFSFVQKYARELEGMIVYSRDYLLTYFGFKTLEKGYLLKTSTKVVIERPQDMFMRVSVFMHFKVTMLLPSKFICTK
jgi:glutaredoxin